MALSKRTGVSWKLPKWEYAKYFQFKWNLDEGEVVKSVVREHSFDHCSVVMNYPCDHTSFHGHWQSEKYFDDVWNKIGGQFKFNQGFFDSVWDRMEFRPGKNDYAVHLRFGDYVNNPNYPSIPTNWYLDFFKRRGEFYVFTDDYDMAKRKLGRHSNVQYVEGCTDIEHLVLISQFKNIIVINSSFGWWGAKLSELYGNNPTVYRPDVLFGGELSARTLGRDFYPERWIMAATKKRRTDRFHAQDVTFVIPVTYDHHDRLANLEIVVDWLASNLDTNILIGEQKGDVFSGIDDTQHINFGMVAFHRTKIINELVKKTSTPIVFNWDADVMCEFDSLCEAIELLRHNADVVYPYDGSFTFVNRNNFDINNPNISGCKIIHDSVGGALGFNKSSFIKAGMENEYFIRFGSEDRERYARFINLGLNVKRTDGALFHMEHYRGRNSQYNNPHRVVNHREYKKVEAMSKESLESYISTWVWVPRT